MMEVMRAHYANPASLHQAGTQADQLIGRARGLLSRLFQTSGGTWLFTGGGTEANNLAIKGAARQFAARGKHLITTAIEHASVYDTFRQLELEGFHVTYLPVDESGHVKADMLLDALTKETTLVSVMHVNNEVGTVQPVEEIGKLVKTHSRALFHVDAVQSIGKLEVAPERWHADLVSGSAHKVRGPKGVGFLYVRDGVALQPLMNGGSQETGMRPGTSNVAGIVAGAQALRLTLDQMPERQSRMRRLRAQLTEAIADIPELSLSGSEPFAPHIVHVAYPGMKPEAMLHMLEQHGIIASTKSACSSKDSKPSRVLLAMGAGTERASSGIRISFGDEHGERDIDKLVEALRATVTKLKPLERRLT